jgi:hypothetical protein
VLLVESASRGVEVPNADDDMVEGQHCRDRKVPGRGCRLGVYTAWKSYILHVWRSTWLTSTSRP